MALPNFALVGSFAEQWPHTYVAFQKLTMAMADAYNNKGKIGFFGRDKGLKSLMEYETRLKETLIAMTLDGIVNRFDSAEDFHRALVILFDYWFNIFQKWPDAGQFAKEQFVTNPEQGRKLIASLMGLSK